MDSKLNITNLSLFRQVWKLIQEAVLARVKPPSCLAITSITADRNVDATNSANCCMKAYGGVSSAASCSANTGVKTCLKIAEVLDLPLGTRERAERGRRT